MQQSLSANRKSDTMNCAVAINSRCAAVPAVPLTHVGRIDPALYAHTTQRDQNSIAYILNTRYLRVPYKLPRTRTRR
jgi:hypothetical protein